MSIRIDDLSLVKVATGWYRLSLLTDSVDLIALGRAIEDYEREQRRLRAEEEDRL